MLPVELPPRRLLTLASTPFAFPEPVAERIRQYAEGNVAMTARDQAGRP
jgi:hypothetical protein